MENEKKRQIEALVALARARTHAHKSKVAHNLVHFEPGGLRA